MINEAQSSEKTISDFLKIRCVIAGFGQTDMKEHLLLRSIVCDNWNNFAWEIASMEHANHQCTEADGT